ncbi:gephyrin-like [Ctenocephalides felis]|uniref:gephyrin-like n=1 Tax=Ctenocephalides felis TaxID=7515 RepID=UPI000E6E5A9E|nr:gephyrin-like [Ctenocephalides felis]
MSKHFKYAVVTVSDSCSCGTAEDTSGPNLVRLLETKFGASGVIYRLVPDDILKIKECLETLISQDVALILTTGGTGFSPRDVTPEATRAVIQKEASGITHAMMSGSLKVTPHAMLSRGISGICDSTLIVNLPGSKKASQECFEIIHTALPHAICLIRDLQKDVKAIHQEMQGQKSGCRHTHSNADVNKIAYRLRSSPYPMLSVHEANHIIEDIISSGALLKEFAEKLECLKIDKCLNRILAEDIYSKISLPPFRASIKDGYAAISTDEVGPREVLQGICAGDYANIQLKPGQCVRINTGAMVPDSADCVIQVEDTKLLKHSDDGTQELQIEVMVKQKVDKILDEEPPISEHYLEDENEPGKIKFPENQ